jgi:hypothetical protein
MTAGGPIDILWGWDSIAAALGVDTDTAKALAGQGDYPLPVFRTGGKKSVQSTRAALQSWADRRAWSLAAGKKEGEKSQ